MDAIATSYFTLVRTECRFIAIRPLGLDISETQSFNAKHVPPRRYTAIGSSNTDVKARDIVPLKWRCYLSTQFLFSPGSTKERGRGVQLPRGAVGEDSRERRLQYILFRHKLCHQCVH